MQIILYVWPNVTKQGFQWCTAHLSLQCFSLLLCRRLWIIWLLRMRGNQPCSNMGLFFMGISPRAGWFFRGKAYLDMDDFEGPSFIETHYVDRKVHHNVGENGPTRPNWSNWWDDSHFSPHFLCHSLRRSPGPIFSDRLLRQKAAQAPQGQARKVEEGHTKDTTQKVW